MLRLEFRGSPAGRLNQRSRALLDSRRNVTSQLGEDGLIERIFQIIGIANKWSVEFGANDGRHVSNTWNLIHNMGWTGVLIEGDSNCLPQLHENCKDVLERTRIVEAFVGIEGDYTLDAILTRLDAPNDIDLLSIDIDGDDWHVWNAVKIFRPRVVVIEFNPTIDNDVLFVQDYRSYHGSSLSAMIELGKAKGYELVAATDFNALFVIQELFPQFGIVDNSIDAIYSSPHLIRVFQGFDGTIFPTGDLRLLWKGPIELTSEDFQVIPASMRRR
jgi:hypothetical protein